MLQFLIAPFSNKKAAIFIKTSEFLYHQFNQLNCCKADFFIIFYFKHITS